MSWNWLVVATAADLQSNYPFCLLQNPSFKIKIAFLLAEGYRRSRRGYDFQGQRRRRAGPLHGASPHCSQNVVAR